MVARDGYHWFLPGWHTIHWWDTEHFNNLTQREGYSHKENIPCRTSEMDVAIDLHMTLRNAFFGSKHSRIVGNMTVEQWNRTYSTLIEAAVS